MMPDKALAVTERQFASLLGVDPGDLLKFTPGEIARGPAARSRIAADYRDLLELPTAGLDVLVISGANVSDPVLPRQVFWRSLTEILSWALATGVPTLCSCLATHAVLEFRHEQKRRPAQNKVWGVYEHQLVSPGHELLRGLPSKILVPHSRHNELGVGQFATAGYDVLLAGAEAGVHLAVEREQGRWLLMQGHPEYEAISLLKEYKREVKRWQACQRADYPALPVGYLDHRASAILHDYRTRCERAGLGCNDHEGFPEARVAPYLSNTWREAAQLSIANWLRLVA